jgi:hypothetical protein
LFFTFPAALETGRLTNASSFAGFISATFVRLAMIRLIFVHIKEVTADVDELTIGQRGDARRDAGSFSSRRAKWRLL